MSRAIHFVEGAWLSGCERERVDEPPLAHARGYGLRRMLTGV
jgi:hypothetical protein